MPVKYRCVRNSTGIIYEEVDGVVTIDNRGEVPNMAHHIMPDIQPYQSMINGKWIESRSEHRSHLKANGCIEVGTETKYLSQRQTPPPASPSLKRTLIDVFNSKT